MKLGMIGILTLLAFSCSEEAETINTGNLSRPQATVARNPLSNARTEGYSFDGTEGDPIAFDLAKRWVKNYTENNPDQTRAHFFGSEIIKQLLTEEGCVGIRIYYALDENGQKQLLLVGVDKNGQDLLPEQNGRTASSGNIIADYSSPCPSYCGGDGLN